MGEEAFLAAAMNMRSKLYHVAMSILWNEQDAADAMQEAMLKGWKRRATLRDEALFEAWFTRILVNQCRDMLRRRKRGPLPLDAEISREDRLCEDLQLRQALRALPEKYRLPLVLHHLEGYSVREVAQMLKLPEALVASRLYQARGALRRLLDGGDGV